jgi:hypothetical protein
VSVGHVARVFEERGIATTSVYIEAFAHYAAAMRLPRVALTRFPMGRPLGPPGRADTQSLVVRAALELIDTATAGETVKVVTEPYRPGGGGT